MSTRPLFSKSTATRSNGPVKQNQFGPSTGYPLDNSNYHDTSYAVESVQWDDPNYDLPQDVHNLSFRGSIDDGRSSQLDNIFDAYGEFESGEEDNVREFDDDDRSDYGSSPQVEEIQPWDTRGKTGLYGGGGRGGNDSETGWVQDYDTRSNSIWSQEGSDKGGEMLEVDEIYTNSRRSSRRREENFVSDEVPQFSGGALRLLQDDEPILSNQHVRHSSSSTTDHSSYGPETPVGASKEFFHQSSIPMNQVRVASPELQPFYEPSFVEPEVIVPVQKVLPVQKAPTKFPRKLSRNPPPLLASLDFPSSQSTSNLAAKTRPPHPTSHSAQSYLTPAPLHATFLLPAAVINEASPPKPPKTGRNAPLIPAIKSKSATAGAPLSPSVLTPEFSSSVKKAPSFRRGLSKGGKMPKISSPILPEGFVESLGMTTFALDLKNPERNRQPIKYVSTEREASPAPRPTPPTPSRQQSNNSSLSSDVPSTRLPTPNFNSSRQASPRVDNFHDSPVSSQGAFSSNRGPSPVEFQEASNRRRSYISTNSNRPKFENGGGGERRGEEKISDHSQYQKSVAEASRHPLPSSPWTESSTSSNNNSNNTVNRSYFDPSSSQSSAQQQQTRSPTIPKQQPQIQSKHMSVKPTISTSVSMHGFSDPWNQQQEQSERSSSFNRTIPPPISIPSNSYPQSINSAPVPSDYRPRPTHNGSGSTLNRSQSSAASSRRTATSNGGGRHQSNYSQDRYESQGQQQRNGSGGSGGRSSNNTSRQPSPDSTPNLGRGDFQLSNNKPGERVSLANRPSHHYRKTSTAGGGSGGSGNGGGEYGRWGEQREEMPNRRVQKDEWIPSWQ